MASWHSALGARRASHLLNFVLALGAQSSAKLPIDSRLNKYIVCSHLASRVSSSEISVPGESSTHRRVECIADLALDFADKAQSLRL